jgi:hypothetical protein
MLTKMGWATFWVEAIPTSLAGLQWQLFIAGLDSPIFAGRFFTSVGLAVESAPPLKKRSLKKNFFFLRLWFVTRHKYPH